LISVSLTRHLEAKSVRASRWANRHESSYTSKSFTALKLEIANAGGNVQPIKVRKANDGDFEVVFGHRRQRACLELGLPVLATVVSMDDRSLWVEMERENRLRADLCPYEKGLRYSAALDAGLYPTIRPMAEGIGADYSQVAKMIRLAELPQEVVDAFNSPSDLQVNWSTALRGALQRDPEALMGRTRKIRQTKTAQSSPRDIFHALTEEATVEPFHKMTVEIANADGRPFAVINKFEGGYNIRIQSAGIPIWDVEAALRGLLQS